MDLRSHYAKVIQDHGFETDDAQLNAIAVLDRLARELIDISAPGALIARLKRRYIGKVIRSFADSEPASGVYLWGGVGRGKTLLISFSRACLSMTN